MALDNSRDNLRSSKMDPVQNAIDTILSDEDSTKVEQAAKFILQQSAESLQHAHVCERGTLPEHPNQYVENALCKVIASNPMDSLALILKYHRTIREAPHSFTKVLVHIYELQHDKTVVNTIYKILLEEFRAFRVKKWLTGLSWIVYEPFLKNHFPFFLKALKNKATAAGAGNVIKGKSLGDIKDEHFQYLCELVLSDNETIQQVGLSALSHVSKLSDFTINDEFFDKFMRLQHLNRNPMRINFMKPTSSQFLYLIDRYPNTPMWFDVTGVKIKKNEDLFSSFVAYIKFFFGFYPQKCINMLRDVEDISPFVEMLLPYMIHDYDTLLLMMSKVYSLGSEFQRAVDFCIEKIDNSDCAEFLISAYQRTEDKAQFKEIVYPRLLSVGIENRYAAKLVIILCDGNIPDDAEVLEKCLMHIYDDIHMGLGNIANVLSPECSIWLLKKWMDEGRIQRASYFAMFTNVRDEQIVDLFLSTPRTYPPSFMWAVANERKSKYISSRAWEYGDGSMNNLYWAVKGGWVELASDRIVDRYMQRQIRSDPFNDCLGPMLAFFYNETDIEMHISLLKRRFSLLKTDIEFGKYGYVLVGLVVNLKTITHNDELRTMIVCCHMNSGTTLDIKNALKQLGSDETDVLATFYEPEVPLDDDDYSDW